MHTCVHAHVHLHTCVRACSLHAQVHVHTVCGVTERPESHTHAALFIRIDSSAVSPKIPHGRTIAYFNPHHRSQPDVEVEWEEPASPDVDRWCGSQAAAAEQAALKARFGGGDESSQVSLVTCLDHRCL